jgi:chondroitin AC lyase
LKYTYCIAGVCHNADEEVIRSRIVIELENPADTRWSILSDLSGDGTWSAIDYKTFPRTGFRHGEHLSNMVEMALAVQTARIGYGSPALKSGFDKALSYWLENDFE